MKNFDMKNFAKILGVTALACACNDKPSKKSHGGGSMASNTKEVNSLRQKISELKQQYSKVCNENDSLEENNKSLKERCDKLEEKLKNQSTQEEV